MRWRAWLPRLTLLGIVSCSATGRACAWCKDIGMTCAAIGYLCVEYETETHAIEKRRKACRNCAGGTACNILEEPPKCTPDPGVEGTACGTFQGDKKDYVCGDGLRCDHDARPNVCRVAPQDADAD